MNMEPIIGESESIIYADEATNFSLHRELMPVQVVARFTVEGEPKVKGRPRFARRGKQVHTYTPQTTKDAENTIAWTFRAAAPGWTPLSGQTFGVAAKFFNGTRQRRDVDNMIKLICDGLNGVAWEDDNQVNEVSGRKVQDQTGNPRTEVLIYLTGEHAAPQKKCIGCEATFPTYESTADRKYCTQECSTEHRKKLRTRSCGHCGEEFSHRNASEDAKYCSRECYSLDNTNLLACEICKVEFRRPKSQTKGRAFCSNECFTTSKSYCIRGHEYTPENTYTPPRGRKQCRECRAIRSRDRKAQEKARRGDGGDLAA